MIALTLAFAVTVLLVQQVYRLGVANGFARGKAQRDRFLHDLWQEENERCLQLIARTAELEARLDHVLPGWREPQ